MVKKTETILLCIKYIQGNKNKPFHNNVKLKHRIPSNNILG